MYTKQDVDFAYLAGVLNASGVDGLYKETQRLKDLNINPSDLIDSIKEFNKSKPKEIKHIAVICRGQEDFKTLIQLKKYKYSTYQIDSNTIEITLEDETLIFHKVTSVCDLRGRRFNDYVEWGEPNPHYSEIIYNIRVNMDF